MEARQTIDAESIRFAAFVLDVPAEYLQQLLIDPSKGDKSGQPLPAPAEAAQSATSQSHFADDELQRITFSDGIEEAYIASVGAKNDVSNWQVCSTLPTLQQTSLESQSNDFVAHHDQLNAQYITPFASQKQTHEKQLAPSARPNPASLQRPSHDGSSSHRSNFVPIAMPPSTGSRSSREEFLPKKNSPSRIRDLVELVGTQGPCSSTWTLPRYRGRRKNSQVHRQARPSKPGEPARRRAFRTEMERNNTALTRKLKSCIRCRVQKIRCELDSEDPLGPCQTCKNLSRPRIDNLKCIRSIITDSSLYREQDAPWQLFSRRWQSMDLVDITTWSSFETKEIAISQIFLDAPLKLTVREFTPMDGDMLEETWKSGDSTIVHSLPRYAIVEMNEAACTIGSFIDKSIGAYITAMVDGPDNLLWCTYMMAFKQVSTAQTVEEQILLRDCFRLWVSCLMTSYPNHIVGHERLGSDKIRDPLSQHFGMTPIPLLMVAQMECIHYTKFLRPLSKKVLDSLQDLVLSSKKRQKAWFTIYLTLFVLLHGCALVTRRDAETATQYGLTQPYANPKSIQAHQSGAQTMLAHWHYVDKGLKPFQMALTSEGLKEVAKRANLNPEQTDLVRTTATWIRDQGSSIQAMKTTRAFGHNLYWIVQMFEEGWEPGPTA